ncbi:MAG: arabinose isomerase [Planctomycetia bacterium]|nr:arabinose isomerase [Planctomycetia bacterium]
MESAREITVGLYGIGLDTYWPQFEGLYDRLVGYQNQVAEKLRGLGARVVNVGLIDSPVKSAAAAQRFQQEDVELIFLYVSTYALSSTVLPVVSKLKKPVVVLNLQPTRAIDYASFNALGDRTKMTGEWLANCQACSVPEIANAFLRSNIQFHQITGVLQDDPVVDAALESWISAARVASTLRRSRVGLVGHYYNGMLDVYSDLTRLASQLGVHFEIREFGEILALRERVSELEITDRVSEIREEFDVQPDCVESELRRAARTSLALDLFVQEHDLHALAYFYNGHGDARYEDLIASVIVGNSMLTARNIPVAGEYEVKNCLAMKIMDAFGVGGAFSEFYALDFDDDIVLLGHDGPCHPRIAQGKTKIKPLKVYHGKVGEGLSVETSVQYGPTTLLSVIDAPDGNVKFLVAEAESEAGPILEIGNTNSRYRFSIGARGFIDAWSGRGPSHHCAIGVGHIADKLEILASILGLEFIRVC